MNDFNITLTIEDIFCNKCCKESKQTQTTVTSTSQTISLQNNYILNIIQVSTNFFTVLIQNGVNVIIRNIYTNFTTSICIPNQCGTHFIRISGTIQ